MQRNVFMMLGACVLALIALVLIGALSYHWSYTDTAFGGHAGFVLPVLLGFCLFVLGSIYGRAESDRFYEREADSTDACLREWANYTSRGL